MDQKISVSLKKVGKLYRVRHHNSGLLGNLFQKKREERFWAVKGVDLIINKGDRIGLIGSNGSGKTTLLKMIAGITMPTVGKVITSGSVVALMDLEAGFNPDLSGEENIFLNGMIVGMTKKQIKDKLVNIIDFADVGKFIDAPFYTYSSGMKFRLAFSIASASDCDILVIDEIFLSGDLGFQEKTFGKIKDIQKDKKITTIFCSHTPLFIQGLSNKFYEMEKGRLIKRSYKYIDNLIDIQNEEFNKIFTK